MCYVHTTAVPLHPLSCPLIEGDFMEEILPEGEKLLYEEYMRNTSFRTEMTS